MAKTISITAEEQFARDYADRLILKELSELNAVVRLSEVVERLSDHGLGLAAVRSLLATNPDRFSYVDRRWVPAARVEGQDKPISERIRLTVERMGGPVSLNLLTQELETSDIQIDEDRLKRIIECSPDFALTPGNNVFVKQWCFSAWDEPIDTALRQHGLNSEELEEAKKKLENVNFRDADAVCKAVIANAPMSSKLFGAVAWLHLNPQDATKPLRYDWQAFYGPIFDLTEVTYLPSRGFVPTSDSGKLIKLAEKLADKLAPQVEIEDAQPIEVKDEDTDKMVKQIVAASASVTATKLLEQHYEITPSVKTFPDDIKNLMDALKERKEVLWVGGDRFNKPSVVPDLVKEVPDLFQYEQTPFLDEEEEFVDSELTDDGLTSTLRKLLNHPLAMDVLDEEAPVPTKQVPQSIRCVLKSIHREVGTFPMSQIPEGWIENSPREQELIFIDQNGRELIVWANTEGRLLFNLIDWFYEQPVESGAVFSLTRTNKPNVFEFEWLEQSDPVVYITNQRMEELREIQSRAEEMSTYEVLREVMSHWPKGADFLTLLWEVNVVRRSSRRLVASLLSSYACFYQRSGSPVWHYDSKKVEQGFDKAKRKFIKK